MQSVVFNTFSHSNRPELTQLLKMSREAHKKHMADSEKEKGNEAMSDDPFANLCISTSSALGALPDKWKMNFNISQHLKTKPLAFFSLPGLLFQRLPGSRGAPDVFCKWFVLPLDWNCINKWLISNSEPEFITSRNPEKTGIQLRNSLLCSKNQPKPLIIPPDIFKERYFSERSMKYHRPNGFGNFFWYLGFRHPKKCARRTTVVVCSTWQMILPPGRIVPWSGTSEMRKPRRVGWELVIIL